jgi:hypothetical protein
MIPDSDMGHPDNITTETLVRAGKAAGNKNIKDVVDKMLKTYNMMIKGKPADPKTYS